MEIIEYHPQRVLDAFRQGEFDQIEIIGEADEKEFFELAFQEKILFELADSMPTARKKEEVPRWFVLAANLSLKLHQENSYSAFERVVRCGGLLSALDPRVASKHLDAQTKEILLQCQGFNDKNTYDRTTPCDQDFLRKFVKDVPAKNWRNWFNGPVQQTWQQYGFFDPQGIFIGDGSYLFVPDNPNYEGSVLMWFDEHNHPVKYDELSEEERKKARRRRCYKLVSLLHLRGDCSVYAALAIVPGNDHESPVLYELVEKFVAAVGPGVMKLLILDRGFVDGKNISRCKKEWGIDVLMPLKRNLDIWTDAWALSSQHPWQTSSVPPPPAPLRPPAGRPEHLQKREAKRQRTLRHKKSQAPPPDPSKIQTKTEMCAIPGFTSWTDVSVPIHVLLMREHYGDGHTSEWGLMDTRPITDPSRPKRDYQRRTEIEERHRLLKCFYDLCDFQSRSGNVIVAQVVFILLSYTLRQWQIWKRHPQLLPGQTPGQIRRRLNLRREYVVIYHQQAYTQMPLVTFTREVLELEGQARIKALAKIRQLEKSLLAPIEKLRPP